MWQRLIRGIVILVAVLAVLAILYIGAQAMGVAIPDWLVQIVKIVVIAGVVIGAIYAVVEMIRSMPGGPPTP
jgi:hypothetical protein